MLFAQELLHQVALGVEARALVNAVAPQGRAAAVLAAPMPDSVAAEEREEPSAPDEAAATSSSTFKAGRDSAPTAAEAVGLPVKEESEVEAGVAETRRPLEGAAAATAALAAEQPDSSPNDGQSER